MNRTILLILLSFTASLSHAALSGRLETSPGSGIYQAYHDDEADLTWLQDANAAGLMNWAAADTWAAGLDISGADEWRLPTALNQDSSGPCSGYNCTGSEMGNLFYNVLGGSAGSSITSIHNANFNLFSNVQSDFYWSATVYAPDTLGAWTFYTSLGTQDPHLKSYNFYAWAVHSGDVSAVPIPAAVWLFGSGLIGLIGAARRKR